MYSMHYLYRITNVLNGKVYIGQTVNEKFRWIAHKSYAKQENPVQYVHRAMKKYGVENFTYEVIAQCLTQKDADGTEERLIEQYNSQGHERGYNIARGGNHAWNAGLSPELQPMYGKHHSEESKKKISKSNLGKEMPLHTQEQKDHMSKIMTGRKITWGDKIGLARKGIKHTLESRKKMSESQKGNQAGEKHPRAKLTQTIVESIRKEYAENKTTKTALGEKYGVSRTMISNIVKNKNWNT